MCNDITNTNFFFLIEIYSRENNISNTHFAWATIINIIMAKLAFHSIIVHTYTVFLKIRKCNIKSQKITVSHQEKCHVPKSC